MQNILFWSHVIIFTLTVRKSYELECHIVFLPQSEVIGWLVLVDLRVMSSSVVNLKVFSHLYIHVYIKSNSLKTKTFWICFFFFPISLWRSDELIPLSRMKSFTRIPLDIPHASREIWCNAQLDTCNLTTSHNSILIKSLSESFQESFVQEKAISLWCVQLLLLL